MPEAEDPTVYDFIEDISQTYLQTPGLSLTEANANMAQQLFKEVLTGLQKLDLIARTEPSAFLMFKELLQQIYVILGDAILDEDEYLPAARVLVASTDYAVRLLRELQSEPEVRAIARKVPEWPILARPLLLRPSPERKELLDLKVGEDLVDKDFNTRIQTNRIAYTILHTLEKNQTAAHERDVILKLMESNPGLFSRKYVIEKFPDWAGECAFLPLLTSATWRQWFDVGWRALLETTNGRPEKSFLRGLGQYRARHSEQTGAQVMGAAKPATIDANIRDGIKNQLQLAFKRLVQKRLARARGER